MHGEVSDDVILIGHGFPLPVLFLYVLLQVEAALLGNVVLLEERLRKKDRGRKGKTALQHWMKNLYNFLQQRKCEDT